MQSRSIARNTGRVIGMFLQGLIHKTQRHDSQMADHDLRKSRGFSLTWLAAVVSKLFKLPGVYMRMPGYIRPITRM